MRILHLISSSGYFGADHMLIELARGLRDSGVSVAIGVFRNEQNPRLEVVGAARSAGIPVEILPCRGKVDLRTVRHIRKLVDETRVDLIHTHGYKSNLYGLAATGGMGIRRVATCHNWLGEGIKMKGYARLDKLFLRRFDKVVAVSEGIRIALRDAGIPLGKVVTIPNGVDLQRFETAEDGEAIRMELGIPAGYKVIGTVGRLSEEKGHLYLVQAALDLFAEDRKVVLLLVGDGPLRERLEEEARRGGERGASRILFAGVREDMERVYGVIDIFVLPSLTEGLPMALLEAAACRKPIVATSVGGVPVVIRDGESGRLVAAGDVAGLREAIRAFLDDAEWARSMAENVYRVVRERFCSEEMVRRYAQLYREVAGQGGGDG